MYYTSSAAIKEITLKTSKNPAWIQFFLSALQFRTMMIKPETRHVSVVPLVKPGVTDWYKGKVSLVCLHSWESGTCRTAFTAESRVQNNTLREWEVLKAFPFLRQCATMWLNCELSHWSCDFSHMTGYTFHPAALFTSLFSYPPAIQFIALWVQICPKNLRAHMFRKEKGIYYFQSNCVSPVCYVLKANHRQWFGHMVGFMGDYLMFAETSIGHLIYY